MPYGNSKTCTYTPDHGAGVFIDFAIKLPMIFLFPTGRKEDETDEKWMEKERERARKEREREEKGKKTQM